MAKVIGRGFLATELAKRQLPEAVYYFSGVSSQMQLKGADKEKLMLDELVRFLGLVTECAKTKKYLIYASSATVPYPNTDYAKLKSNMETIAQASTAPTLGIRLPAVYGPGEAHKGASASVVFQWTKEMMDDQSPVIFGDGLQTRDFMYIDDAIDQVVELASNHRTGVYSVGTGIETSFNDVVGTINKVLGKKIKATHIDRPTQYIQSTTSLPVSFKVSLEQGITKIHDSQK